MNPKTKANELIESFTKASLVNRKQAVQCSISLCNEFINEHTLKEPSRFNVERHNFWVDVLTELKQK